MNLEKLQLAGLESGVSHQNRGQISHGLNLVLKLRHPAAMPLLLAKIHQAQRKIDAGLGELNFVHFARFLPTYDNRALQVITEFDGPLAPYVLDFAIEIGDVFDMLLSFTEGTEDIVPIAKHATEFLAFVEKNNTVSVPPIPPVPDWGLYAAYPEQTVLEITGPRNDLPTPKADRWATPVDRDDVQGNILNGYRAKSVKHLVLRVVDAPKARAWLADKATPEATSPGGVPQLTSHRTWVVGAEPELMLNIGLTHAGMEALGIRSRWLAHFPEAFKQGAVQRAEDNFDVGLNAPDQWWLGGPEQEPAIHVMLSLYHKPSGRLAFNAVAQALKASLPGAGLELLKEVDAASRGGKSWFDYADGIATPRIASACPAADMDRDKDLQPAASAGEFVLGGGYKNIYGGSSLGELPAALATNGTFCAVRVLAQDTSTFKDAVKNEAARLGVCEKWLAAKLMGRWFNGAPLSLHPDKEPTDEDEKIRNDFDYGPSYEYPGTPMDHAGERCPVGAHIRRSNPRTARVAGARYARRLMRRGMHYEIPDPEGKPAEVGLFGMFICADLERQFEFIQRQWINGDRFAAGLRGTRDPFVGTPTNDYDEFEIPVPDGPALKLRLPPFVRTRGSMYLFMPGLNALRQLERFATVDPPTPWPLAPAAAGPEDTNVSVLQSLQGLNAIDAPVTQGDLLGMALASVGNPRAAPHAAPAGPRVVSLLNLDFDPRRRDFQINPYPVFADFRVREPVHYSPLYKGWFVFGYDDVVRVCTENDNFSAVKQGSTGPRGLFTLDEPEHGLVRQKVKDAWDLAAADTDFFVQRSIKKALDAIGSRACFDLVDDLARPIPRDVYFDILGGKGIDAKERLAFDVLARKVMKHHDNTLDLVQTWDGVVAGLELASRMTAMLVAALSPLSPYRGSFLAHLARQVNGLGGPLSPQAAVMTLVNLTVAGYMSVEFLLATGIRRLLLDGGAGWQKVKADPATLLPLYLREMRRTEHALAVIDRFAKKEVTIGGIRIPEGASVFGVLASANRDKNIFGADADDFDPHRCLPKQQHLGLGWGTHECMGRELERHISAPALAGLLAAMPGLHLQSTAQPPWFQNFYFRSFDHLTVTVK